MRMKGLIIHQAWQQFNLCLYVGSLNTPYYLGIIKLRESRNDRDVS